MCVCECDVRVQVRTREIPKSHTLAHILHAYTRLYIYRI